MAHNRRLSQFANTVGYNSGKIGFHATNPPRDYCFHSGQADTNIQITNDTTGIDDSAGALIQQDGNDLYIWNKENSFMSLGTNAGERLRITNAGYVLKSDTPVEIFTLSQCTMFDLSQIKLTSLKPQSIIRLVILNPEKSRSTCPAPKLKFKSVDIFFGIK